MAPAEAVRVGAQDYLFRDELDGRHPEVTDDGTLTTLEGDQHGTELQEEPAPPGVEAPTGPATSG